MKSIGMYSLILTAGLLVASNAEASYASGQCAFNPLSGRPEMAYESSGPQGLDIYYIDEHPEGSQPQPLTSSALDEREPRIAISETHGDTWVVYEREGGTVHARIRDYASLDWGTEIQLSSNGEFADNPDVATLLNFGFAVYESANGSLTEIKAGIIDDKPNPFGIQLLGTSAFAGDVDAAIQSEATDLWVTWIGTGGLMWVRQRLATGAWSGALSVPMYEQPADEVRRRIRDYIVDGVPLD